MVGSQTPEIYTCTDQGETSRPSISPSTHWTSTSLDSRPESPDQSRDVEDSSHWKDIESNQ